MKMSFSVFIYFRVRRFFILLKQFFKKGKVWFLWLFKNTIFLIFNLFFFVLINELLCYIEPKQLNGSSCSLRLSYTIVSFSTSNTHTHVKKKKNIKYTFIPPSNKIFHTQRNISTKDVYVRRWEGIKKI